MPDRLQDRARRSRRGPGRALVSCPCGASHDDEAPGRLFYVSVVDGGRYGFLSGPYATHAEAMADVNEVQVLAEKHDPGAAFYAFGTARAPEGYTTPGILNEALQAERAARGAASTSAADRDQYGRRKVKKVIR